MTEVHRFVCSGLSLRLQTGKVNMSQTSQDWICSSGCSPPLNCRLAICTNIAFPQAFSGSAKVSAYSQNGSEHNAMFKRLKYVSYLCRFSILRKLKRGETSTNRLAIVRQAISGLNDSLNHLNNS